MTRLLATHLHRGQAQETMGCGASVNNVKASGASLPPKKIKVKRARRFDAQEGLSNDFSMHAKLSMYMLFAKYDVDASGEIDANELYKMMLDTLPIKSTAKAQDYDDQDFDLLAAALDDADEEVAPTYALQTTLYELSLLQFSITIFVHELYTIF